MRSQKIITLLFFCACLIPPLHAQEAQEKALTLQECTHIALQNNPLILSSQQQYQASLARISQARASRASVSGLSWARLVTKRPRLFSMSRMLRPSLPT